MLGEGSEDRRWFWCTNQAEVSAWISIDLIRIDGIEGWILEN